MFESAYQKVERADQHITDLQVACDTFTNRLQNFGFYVDRQSNEMIVEVRLNEPIPTGLPLIIGDAVHNLRTALDHATWELIGIDSGKQNRSLAFPARRVRDDFEAVCSQMATPRDDTKEFFAAFETYPTGQGENLFGLNLLNNADKHQILTPIVGASTIKSGKVVYENGEVMTTLTNCTFTLGPDGRARLMELGPGLSLEFDEKIDPTVDVFFGDVEFFRTAPLIPTLTQLSKAVSGTIGLFVEFVESRL
jgi:hypothetical protein